MLLTYTFTQVHWLSQHPQPLSESTVRLMYLRVCDSRDRSCKTAPSWTSPSLSYSLPHVHRSIGYHNIPQSPSESATRLMYFRVYDSRYGSCNLGGPCFWGGVWGRKRSCHVPWSSSYVHFMSCLQTDQNLCIYLTWAVSEMVVSLYVDTDMSRSGVLGTRHWFVTEWNVHVWVWKLDSSPTCHWSVEVYVPQVPHQSAPVVCGYIYVSCERYTTDIYGYICM